jgi:hypothetical protein
MEIGWLNAVIDLPADRFDEAGRFWSEVTATRFGEIHPDHDEFIHLLPAAGDMHLELQRLNSGPGRVHLDLVVRDIPAWTGRAEAFGARLVAAPGHSVLETPGGVPFCIVPYSTESTKAPVIDPAAPHSADQLCLDVPHDRFDDDVEFWSRLTGWKINPAQLPEFRSFAQPDHLPIRLLIQQLGSDDTGGPRSHLDISCGDHRAAVARRHVVAGATMAREHDHWTELRDPADMLYCVTDRQPSGS